MPHLGWNRGRGVLAILWSLLLALALLPATASADRPFAPRFAANTQGDITIAANGLLSCVTNEPICPAARNGTATPISAANSNARVMTYVDVDGDPATFDSSEASLALPTGARVLFAGLYYGARLAAGTGGAPAPNPGARGTVLLQGAGRHGLPDARRLADRHRRRHLPGLRECHRHHRPSRNLSVFDGLQNVGSGSPGVVIPLSGFTTPRTGPVNSTVGLVAYQGDLGTLGDGATIQGGTGPPTALSKAVNPANNLFNSTISAAEAIVGARNPARRNLLGFDAATDLFAPKIESTKTVDRPTAGLGDELAQTVTFRNTGQDDATGFVATDPIPENTTYVPGSLAIDGAAQSDAARARRLPVCRLGCARAEASVAEQTLTNSATVSSASPDGDGSNDLARLDVPIGPAPPQSPPQSPPSSPGASPQSVDLAPAPSGATSPRRAATTTLTAGRCASSRG